MYATRRQHLLGAGNHSAVLRVCLFCNGGVIDPDAQTRWSSSDERVAWLRLVAIVELLPCVLDAQLLQASQLTHFEYLVLAMLSGATDTCDFDNLVIVRVSTSFSIRRVETPGR